MRGSIGFVLLPLLLGGIAHAATADENPAIWQRIDKNGIKASNVEMGPGSVVAITCPAETTLAQPRLIIQIQKLRNSFFDEKHIYNLRVAVNDYRQEFGMKAMKGYFVFEAKDINQRLQFNELVQELAKASAAGADMAQIALSSLGWRGEMPLTGADRALPGLMDGCDQ
ncbi:hypothetical protein ACFPL7_07895 [Dongia soli]|uniref:Uncharacterized protein n=1 Tax=Dongia soli TaxID=600628 RepID=A0ABU5E927_9PROT|nr:hypothetical protein [Dongia soli]MDY0882867.1 hypothetical protein [Dongia soli]